VNPEVIYIGQNEQLTMYFSRMLGNITGRSPLVFKNHELAAQWLIFHPAEKLMIIFYERNTPDADIEI